MKRRTWKKRDAKWNAFTARIAKRAKDRHDWAMAATLFRAKVFHLYMGETYVEVRAELRWAGVVGKEAME